MAQGAAVSLSINDDSNDVGEKRAESQNIDTKNDEKLDTTGILNKKLLSATEIENQTKAYIPLSQDIYLKQ